MIILKIPYRVSFFGGGTNYPGWYEHSKNGGKTICCAIDKYSYIVLKKLLNAFNYSYRIRYFHEVSIVIPGMLNKEHVRENVLSSELGSYSDEILNKFKKIYKNNIFFIK